MSGLGNFIFSVLTGGLPDKIISAWQANENRKYAAMNDVQRREYEAMAQARADAKEVRLATANFWEMRFLTFWIAFPFVVHVNLVGLDTNFLGGSLRVPKFPPPFDEWEGVILLSFFGVAAGVGALKAVAGAVATRRKG